MEGLDLGWAVLGLVVAALANARLTRLATQDEVTKPLRNRVLRRLDPENPSHLKLAYLLECGWCTSVWVAAAQAGAIGGAPWSPWLWAALSVFAASQITGMLGDVRFYLRNRPALSAPTEDHKE